MFLQLCIECNKSSLFTSLTSCRIDLGSGIGSKKIEEVELEVEVNYIVWNGIGSGIKMI